MNVTQKSVPRPSALLWVLGFTLLLVIGGCAMPGTVDMCKDVRNDESNVLRRQVPAGQ